MTRMTLDEAIKYAEEEAMDKANFASILRDSIKKAIYEDWAEEYIQFAELLKELKQLREQSKWIPVSERLPKAGEYIGDVDKYYLVQNEYGDMLVARYTHSEYWEQIYQLQPIGDKIVAWMPLPEAFKAEREEV